MKTDTYRITYLATIEADVVFEQGLTKEQAKKAFLDGDFEDIIDSEELEVEKIIELEGIGVDESDIEDDDDD